MSKLIYVFMAIALMSFGCDKKQSIKTELKKSQKESLGKKRSDDHLFFCGQSIKKTEKLIVCSYEKLDDLNVLLSFKHLEALDLTKTKVHDFTALKKLENLKYLLLNGSNFSDGTLLQNLKKLSVLGVSETKIKNLSFVKGLKNLVFLEMEKLNLKDKTGVAYLLRRGDISLNLDSKYLEPFLSKEFFTYYTYPKSDFRVYTPIAKGVSIENKEMDKYLLNHSKGKGMEDILKDYPELLLSLREERIEKLSLLWYKNHKMMRMKNLERLIDFKQLSFLMIYVTNRSELDKLYRLKHLKTLHLVLHEDVQKLPELPKSLENLYVYTKGITQFEALKNAQNLDTFSLITYDFRKRAYQILSKKYPRIQIKVFDFFLHSQDAFKFEQREYSFDELERYLASFAEVIKGLHPPKIEAFGRYFELKMLQEYFQVLIKDKEYCDLLLASHVSFQKHLIDHYLIPLKHLNLLDESKETILDCVINEKDLELEELLKKAGAKRACEVLKRKCE